MERLNKLTLALVLLLGPLGCGVKGRPLPPLNPAPLGRGEPTYKETQKKTKKNNYNIQDEDSSSAETEER
ncbi:hypothetical protein QJS83_03725 [Bdellovibrio sp. 22V]|uniref:hypothetical protein n=1 Tax=Bdellovibrio TaxID=958 RepID=UPI002543BE76|nr:hypothetical protein [Bdellovibrio sp. 22V]WII72979.1 hypothetical protein QJS83_03725 [Bdellovibrio sp. 22V]